MQTNDIIMINIRIKNANHPAANDDNDVNTHTYQITNISIDKLKVNKPINAANGIVIIHSNIDFICSSPNEGFSLVFDD